MSSLSDAASGATQASPVGGKIELQFRGTPESLKRLREVLDQAGVFVQVDHEYKNSVWDDDGLVIGALMVPAAERIGAGADV